MFFSPHMLKNMLKNMCFVGFVCRDFYFSQLTWDGRRTLMIIT
jgi:hypothetical protein